MTRYESVCMHARPENRTFWAPADHQPAPAEQPAFRRACYRLAMAQIAAKLAELRPENPAENNTWYTGRGPGYCEDETVALATRAIFGACQDDAGREAIVESAAALVAIGVPTIAAASMAVRSYPRL